MQDFFLFSSSGPEHHVTVTTPSRLWLGSKSWSQQPRDLVTRPGKSPLSFCIITGCGCWLAGLFIFCFVEAAPSPLFSHSWATGTCSALALECLRVLCGAEWEAAGSVRVYL